MKEQNTHVTYTRSELDALPDETDWERVDALTDEDIEKAALSDPDDPPTDADFWKDATVVMPENMEERIMKHPLKVFITYSHTDSQEGGELKERLTPLQHEGLIRIWEDVQILPGDRWEKEISENFADADILLYLVSAASLRSTNCSRELAEALGLAIRVIPIILKECNWLNHQLAGFQGLPERCRPIEQWEDQNHAWQSIVDGIRKLCHALSSAELSFGQGFFLQQLGQSAESIQRYSRAIQRDPNYVDAYNNRGDAYLSTGDYHQAIRDYDTAIELNPEYAMAYNNRAAAWISNQDYHQAIRDYDTAIELNPKYAEAYHNRGNAYRSTGDYDQARRDYNRAEELSRR